MGGREGEFGGGEGGEEYGLYILRVERFMYGQVGWE